MTETKKESISSNDLYSYRELYKALPKKANVVEVGFAESVPLFSVADTIQDNDLRILIIDVPVRAQLKNFYMEYQSLRKTIKRERLQENVSVVLGDERSPYDALKKEAFDLIFISDLFAKELFINYTKHFWERVRRGGVMGGFGWNMPEGQIEQAFDAYFRDYPIRVRPDGVWTLKKQ